MRAALDLLAFYRIWVSGGVYGLMHVFLILAEGNMGMLGKIGARVCRH